MERKRKLKFANTCANALEEASVDIHLTTMRIRESLNSLLGDICAGENVQDGVSQIVSLLNDTDHLTGVAQKLAAMSDNLVETASKIRKG